jgi:hypothetical protein
MIYSGNSEEGRTGAIQNGSKYDGFVSMSTSAFNCDKHISCSNRVCVVERTSMMNSSALP